MTRNLERNPARLTEESSVDPGYSPNVVGSDCVEEGNMEHCRDPHMDPATVGRDGSVLTCSHTKGAYEYVQRRTILCKV